MIDVIRAERIAAQRWRNGGGETRELLAWPNAADWRLRISVADIDADGPFSTFPGVDRCFAVLQGDGVLLRFADRREMLTVDSAPLAFDGAAAPRCELLGGATRDLNLMSRRDAGRASMRRLAVDDEWLDAAPLRAVFTTAPARLQIDDADAADLPAFALAWSAHAGRQRWRLRADDPAVRAWSMAFEAVP